MALRLPLLYNRRHLKDNGFTFHEETVIYDENLQDIMDNTRWYLDNLENLQVYLVRWHNYRSKSPAIPYKYVRNKEGL